MNSPYSTGSIEVEFYARFVQGKKKWLTYHPEHHCRKMLTIVSAVPQNWLLEGEAMVIKVASFYFWVYLVPGLRQKGNKDRQVSNLAFKGWGVSSQCEGQPPQEWAETHGETSGEGAWPTKWRLWWKRLWERECPVALTLPSVKNSPIKCSKHRTLLVRNNKNRLVILKVHLTQIETIQRNALLGFSWERPGVNDSQPLQRGHQSIPETRALFSFAYIKEWPPCWQESLMCWINGCERAHMELVIS